MAGDEFGGDLGVVGLHEPLLGTSEGLEKAFYGAFSRCPELCGGSPHDRGLHIGDGSDLRSGTGKPRPKFVNELPKNAFHNRPDLRVETDGEFTGCRTWTRDHFETHNG